MTRGLVLAAGAAAALLAGIAGAAQPTPSPGPAARAGSALDRAWSSVQDEVADALLLTRIRIALLERLGADGMRVTIRAHGSSVELSGQVEKPASVELAKKVAAAVSGVRSVHSDVTVAADGQVLEPPIAHALGEAQRVVGDALLAAKVKAKLLEQMGRVAFDVQVDAAGGVVTLSGTVPDKARQDLAVRVARSTAGVKELHADLKVKQ